MEAIAFKLEQKLCLYSKQVASPSLNIKSLFLFFSIPCSLPIKSLSALKAPKISGHLLLGNSQDPLISSCIHNGTWKVKDAVLLWKQHRNQLSLWKQPS